MRLVRLGAVWALTAVFALGIPAQPALAAGTTTGEHTAGEQITRYDVQIAVRADGGMRITETITYDFGTQARHGIFRRIPAVFRYDDTRNRIYVIDQVAVSMDGSPVPVGRFAEDGYEVFQIGDPDRTVTGAHTYVVGYAVRGGLNSFADHEELYWNAIGHEWSVPIISATVQVAGPAPIRQVECFAGPAGSRLGCEEKAVSGQAATFRQSRLGRGSGLSTVVAFPAGSIANTGPILVDRRDLAAGFRVTPVTVAGAVGLALAGLGVALAIGWRVGRDRRYAGLLPGLVPDEGEQVGQERRPLIGAPPVSVEFVPPHNIRPGQVGTLIDERANVVDITATIIDFAVRRHLHIRELPRSAQQDWELTKLSGDGGRGRSGGPRDRGFLRYERTLFDALFTSRDSVRLSELKQTFAADLARVRRQLYADMVEQGWYRQSPDRTRLLARTVAALTLVGAGGVTVLLAMFTHAGLVGLGLVAGALALLVVAGWFPARTGRGSAMLARVQGFRLYIATAEAEQIKFHEREKIFSEYLPYAIVFGLAERWAGIFSDIGADGAAAGGAAGATPGLYWYTGVGMFSMAKFNESIGSFTTTTTGAIASTPPSASGSSGFSGGFSGGGGGGGGGGSW